MYIVKAETLKRCYGVIDFFDVGVFEEMKRTINTIRIENKNGKTFVISTNQKIAVVEYCGLTTAPDSYVYLKSTDLLKQQIQELTLKDAKITIQAIPDIALSSLSSDSGLNINDVCYWHKSLTFDKWRNWFVAPSGISSGFMQWDIFNIETLIKASPSGKVVFPEFIDCSKPVIIRDLLCSNWAGTFMPSPDEDTKPAKLPEWL